MKVKPIPKHVHYAIQALLEPYVRDITPVYLVKALKEYDPEGIAKSMPAKLLNKHQVAEILGMSWYSVVRMAKAGEIDAFKIGQQWHFPADFVERLLKEQVADQSAEEND